MEKLELCLQISASGKIDMRSAPDVARLTSRYEMFKRIDADYYGYRDDEDGVLVKLERVAEAEAREKAIREWQRVEAIKQEAKKSVKSGEVASVKPVHENEEDKDLEGKNNDIDFEVLWQATFNVSRKEEKG
jgi:pre-mRNA-splicing factor ISY1